MIGQTSFLITLHEQDMIIICIYLPGDHIIIVITIHEIVARMPAPHNKGNLWLIILSSALLEQVAVEGGRGVGDGVPVVVPGQNIVLKLLK